MDVFTTRPELVGTFGMVASTHWLASASAMAVLEDGGVEGVAAVLQHRHGRRGGQPVGRSDHAEGADEFRARGEHPIKVREANYIV